MKIRQINLYYLGDLFGSPIYVDLAAKPGEDHVIWVARMEELLKGCLVNDIEGLKKLVKNMEDDHYGRNSKA